MKPMRMVNKKIVTNILSKYRKEHRLITNPKSYVALCEVLCDYLNNPQQSKSQKQHILLQAKNLFHNISTKKQSFPHGRGGSPSAKKVQ